MNFLRYALLFMIVMAGGQSAEAPVPVPDPFGLGERLALIDFLQEKRVSIPRDPTIEQLRDLYAKETGKNTALNGSDASERDRRNRMRAALQKDFGVAAPETATEAELASLLAEHRQAREQSNLKANQRAAQQEATTKSSTSKNAPIFSYNKFSEFTHVRTPLRIALNLRPGPNGLERGDSPVVISSSMLFKRMDLSRPAGLVSLSFSCSSRRWRLLEHHDVILIADGVRLDLGKGKHSGDVRDDGSVSEDVSVHITEQQLGIIAKAKVIEGQVGILNIAFDDDERADAKELTGVIERIRRYDAEEVVKILFASELDKSVRIDCATLDRIYADAERRAHANVEKEGVAPAPKEAQETPNENKPSVPQAQKDTQVPRASSPEGKLPKHTIHEAQIGLGNKERAVYIHCETRPTKEQSDRLLQMYRARATKRGQVVVKIFEDDDWWPVAVDNLDGSPIIYP